MIDLRLRELKRILAVDPHNELAKNQLKALRKRLGPQEFLKDIGQITARLVFGEKAYYSFSELNNEALNDLASSVGEGGNILTITSSSPGGVRYDPIEDKWEDIEPKNYYTVTVEYGGPFDKYVYPSTPQYQKMKAFNEYRANIIKWQEENPEEFKEHNRKHRKKYGRNSRCWCLSGKKFKKCCLK